MKNSWCDFQWPESWPDPSGTGISKSSEFSVVNGTKIALNIPHKAHIFPNVTMRDVPIFALNSQIRLSVICLSVVCLSLLLLNVCALTASYSGSWRFRQYLSDAVYLTILPLTSVQNFTDIFPEEPPSSGALNHAIGGRKLEWRWTYRRLYQLTGQQATKSGI